MLGRFAVRVDGRTVERGDWRLTRAATVVKLLALAPRHRLHREELADQLWRDAEPDKVSHSLNEAVRRARAALGTTAAANRYLVLDGDTLALCAPGISLRIDVDDFRAAAAAGRDSGEPPLLERAIALYAGDLLPDDRNEEWIGTAREALKAAHVELLMELARAEAAKARWPAVIAALERVLIVEPAQEDAHKALMRVYGAQGDRHRGLEQYERLRRALERAIDAPPDDEAEDLHRALRANASIALPFGAPAEGERAPATPSTLPIETTSFLGRRAELDELRTLVLRRQIVTLTGPPGVGKTRLAVRLAHEQASSRSVWFVDLSRIRDPELVLPTVAASVGVVDRPNVSLRDAVRDRIGDAPVLLVLDNAEHVVRTVSDVAVTLLGACGRLCILVTSRQRLEGPGQVVPVAPFDLPTELIERGADAVRQVEAVQLFVERAQAVQPRFELTERNLGDVVAICRRLDGIPLAIELAAALTRSLSAAQIAERLADRFRVLQRPDSSLPTRHQTLIDAVAWSADLLEEDQKTLLWRLAVFVGGCDLEAIEAVCAGGPIERARVLALVNELIDRSFVATEGALDGPSARYRQLETLREYGAARLAESRDLAALRKRHAVYYLELAERGQRALGFTEGGGADEGRGDQVPWIGRLEREHPNFRAALAWAHANDRELALQLGAALHRFWWMRGYLTEGLSHLSQALAAHTAGPTTARVSALYGASHLALSRADYPAVRRFLVEALRICEQLDDKAGAARAHHVMGTAANWSGDDEVAERHLERALALREEVNDLLGICETRFELALLAVFVGDPARAADLLSFVQPIVEQAQDARTISYVGLLAARAALGLGDGTEAERACARAVQTLVGLNDVWGMWMGLDGMSHVAAAGGDAVRAMTLAGAADGLRHEIGAPLPPAFHHYNEQRLARARLALGDRVAARAWAAGRMMDAAAAARYAIGEVGST
jgi:predicted ATPase/DNA-binding SARP family transcriptional activator